MLIGLVLLLGIPASLSLTHTNNGTQVGQLFVGSNKTNQGCLATLIGEKTILTAADCLKSPKSGTIYFLLGGKQSQVTKVYPSPAKADSEHNYALGALDTSFKNKKGKTDCLTFSWTYKSVEDIGVTVQLESKNFSCRSSQSKSELRVRQMKTEVIRMSCSGMPPGVPKGAPVFIKDNVTSELAMIGVYHGPCTKGKASKNRDVCATRIHMDAFNRVCDLSTKNKLNIPGCQNSWLKQGKKQYQFLQEK